MFEYIARHWAALQQMRKERAEEERQRQPDINEWNNCESWTDFVNRSAQEDQNAVAIWCMAAVAAIIVLALVVQEWDAAVEMSLR